METVILILIVYAIVCMALTADVAGKKGHSSVAWAACGFLFGILGLIAAAGLPSKETMYPRGQVLVKTCPMCAEPIRTEAQVCKYCGQRFSKKEIISGLGVAIEKNGIFRLRAVRILAKLRDEAAIPYLEKALSDSTYIGTHSEATQALINMGTTPALTAVLKKARDRHNQRTAISALARIRDESAIRALISALPDRFTRREVAEALTKIGNPSVPYLEEAIESEGRSIKKRAQSIIAEIKRKSNQN